MLSPGLSGPSTAKASWPTVNAWPGPIGVGAIGAPGWPITEAQVIDLHLDTSNADKLADIEPPSTDRCRETGQGRCAVVEDSRCGDAGAKAAGMKAIGFASGITPAGRRGAVRRPHP